MIALFHSIIHYGQVPRLLCGLKPNVWRRILIKNQPGEGSLISVAPMEGLIASCIEKGRWGVMHQEAPGATRIEIAALTDHLQHFRDFYKLPSKGL